MTDAAPGRTYAVADLHGRVDLLEAALAAIASHACERSSGAGQNNIVFLGDYIDRGPNSAQVLARLIAGPPPGWHWTCLKGNHEAMMALALRNPDQRGEWIDNGGDTTILSYRDDDHLVAAHLAWIDSLAMIEVDIHRVYAHAGVDPAIPLQSQSERTLLWKRYPSAVDEGHGAHHLVHGHDPNIDGPLRLRHRTDLDTLAWRTGRLVVGMFEDSRAGGPVDLIEVTA